MEFQPIKKDTKQPEYIQFPRFLIEIGGLSLNAKMAYMLIYDRVRQNVKNSLFIDKSGSPFCFFSNEELSESLGLSIPTIKRAISELKEKGLLKREKDGLNRVKTFVNVPKSRVKNEPSEGKDLILPRVKNEPSEGKDLIRPIPYIVKNNCKEQCKENMHAEKKPKTKKISKAQETTKTVIEHWNKQHQTKYSSESKGTIKLVESLLKSGYQQDQILQVIDYRAKTRKTEADYKWFVPATVLALKNFERSYQFMINDQNKPQTKTTYKNRNKIPESVTLPDWYQVKESEQASESDVKRILDMQKAILKGTQS